MCPLCTKTGVVLFSIGTIFILLGIIHILPTLYSMWLGIGIIFSAYIIPNLISLKTCRNGTCDASGKTTRK